LKPRRNKFITLQIITSFFRNKMPNSFSEDSAFKLLTRYLYPESKFVYNCFCW
jgi:hypothetical protein